LASVLVVAAVILGARTAVAENLGPGGSRIIVGDEVVGDYRLLVTSAPNPALTGSVTFVIRVSDPQTGRKVLDAQVDIELTLPATGAVLTAPATQQNAGNNIDYAAHISIEQEGQWNGVLRVRGDLGASEVKFTQGVNAPRQLNTVILVGIPFLAILVVFGAMWMARSSERKAVQTSN